MGDKWDAVKLDQTMVVLQISFAFILNFKNLAKEKKITQLHVDAFSLQYGN